MLSISIKKTLTSKHSFFTLVEVLVAMVIVVTGISLVANVMNSSQRKVVAVEQSWSKQHLLSLATEHYLTFGHKVSPPSDLFPIGISVSCLAEAVSKPKEGWVFTKYSVSLFSEGSLLDKQVVYKVIPQKGL